jgi:hypothetical protein
MYKKSISLLVVIILIFSNVISVFAADDTTAPVVTGMTWSASELHVGEVINIEIDAYDTESGINTGTYDTSVYIKHSVSDTNKGTKLVYDEVTKKLKGSITISSDMTSGKWVLNFISVKDNANNRKYYYQSDFTQQYNLNVIGESSDVTVPVVTGMTWSASELHVGEVLNIEIDAYDTESGINTGTYDTSVYIKHSVSDTNKGTKLVYDEVTQKLKGSIAISSDMTSGKWVLNFISVKDNANNRKYYYKSDFTQQYNLNVIGETSDVTLPVVTGMTWSATELHVGEVLNIEIDAYDTESGINTGTYDTSVYIKHSVSDTNKGTKLVYDEVTQKLKGSIAISSDMASGKWVLNFISVKDNANNRKYYYQSDFTQQYMFYKKSIFSGTENMAILKGANFDPLEGVTAESPYEGNVTNKITYSGNLNTSKLGFYLIKYSLIGKSNDIYNDYRWITVTNPGNHYGWDNDKGKDVVHLNDDITVEVDSSEKDKVKVIKNGLEIPISENSVLSEEGYYEISYQNTITTSSLMSLGVEPLSTSDSSSNTIGFYIDKTAPVVTGITNNLPTNVLGETEAGAKVEVLLNNLVIGTGEAESDGKFSVEIPLQKAGTEISIIATDKSGNISKVTLVTVKDTGAGPAEPVIKGSLLKEKTVLPGITFSVHTTSGEEKWYDTTTDNIGNFNLNLPDGDYKIEGIWLVSEQKWYIMNQLFTITGGKLVGSEQLQIDVNNPPKEGITGKLAKAGTGLGNVTFSIHTIGDNPSWYDLKSDDTGSFIVKLPDGDFEIDGIWVDSEQKWYELNRKFSVQAGKVVGTNGLSIDVAIQVSKGEIDGTLMKGQTGLGNVVFSIHTIGTTQTWYDFQTDASGNFSKELPDGDYQIDGVWLDSEQKWYALNQAFNVANGQLSGTTKLAVDVLTGSIPQKGKINGKVVKDTTGLGNIVFSIHSTEANPTWYDLQTDANGAFTANLPDGEYQVDGIWIQSESAWYSLNQGFKVSNGQLVGATELVIDTLGIHTSPAEGIKGQLVKGSTGVGNVVFSFHTTGENPSWYDIQTDANGNFKLNLPNGDYQIDGIWLDSESKWYVLNKTFSVVTGKLKDLEELKIDL